MKASVSTSRSPYWRKPPCVRAGRGSKRIALIEANRVNTESNFFGDDSDLHAVVAPFVVLAPPHSRRTIPFDICTLGGPVVSIRKATAEDASGTMRLNSGPCFGQHAEFHDALIPPYGIYRWCQGTKDLVDLRQC